MSFSIRDDRKGCGLRRSPGLAAMPARSLPAAAPITCMRDPYSVAGNERFATVASALIFPPYSRAAATASFLLAAEQPTNRLPEHEVCGDCGPRLMAAVLGLTSKKATTSQTKPSPAAGRKSPARQREAFGKLVRAIRAGKCLPAGRRAGIVRAASKRSDPHTPPQGSAHA